MPSSETTDPVEIASKLLGDTLDADFAFWSAPTSEKYRTPVYRAWKQLQTARKLMSRDERDDAWASLRIIRDAIGEMFGPIASIESEEAVLLRGPEYHHEAEAIITALARLHPAGEAVAWRHTIIEPGSNDCVMLSSRPDNPWSHWLEEHRDRCTYTCEPLYAHPAPTAADTPKPFAKDVAVLRYMAECVETHADKFPVPKHMLSHAAATREIADRLDATAADTGLEERNPMPSGWKFRAEAAEQQLAAAREQIADKVVTDAEIERLTKAATEIHRLSLVIESSVRRGDSAENHALVSAALKAIRAALTPLPEGGQ